MSPLLGKVRDVVTSRWFVKVGFLLIFLWSSVQLLRFLSWARGFGPYVRRPEAVAGLLPVGHFTSLFAWMRGGGWDALLPAGLVIIIASFATSFFFKRGFCGWICPVGTVCEAAALGGRRLFGRNFLPPRPLDLIGRAFRYLLAAAAVFFLVSVPLQEAVAFREFPYMWTADIKILLQFGNPVFLFIVLMALIAMAFIGPFWCRYLCPLGGLYSAVGVLSPLGVRRDPDTCIACHSCTETCHGFVDVEGSERVWQPECDGCMDCVKVCPVEGCLQAQAPGRLRIAPWAWPLLVVGAWVAIWSVAQLTGNWDTAIPPEVFRESIQRGILEVRTLGGL